MFEIIHKDIMGRIGKLKTPHGFIETPALMPVVNPNIELIPPKEIQKMGAQAIITNAYIILRTDDLREKALRSGVQKILDVSVPVMTDSGSYQLFVYGDVEVTNKEIIEFQHKIGSDIIVPLDIPTPPDASRDSALKDLEITISRVKEAKEILNKLESESLLVAPVQGSTYLDLRKKCAEMLKSLNPDVFAIGALVPLLDSYRFFEVVKIILEVKSILPSSRPVHLFGVGHPMFFSIAVALGCDLFDSAAYALYAKDDRYITSHGTKKLEDLRYFPCSCPICLNHTPEELKRMDKDARSELLAKHNLWVSFQEIKLVKQAIKEGTLFELVERRIRSHPNLLYAWRQIRDYTNLIDKFDPSMKQVFFYLGIESIYRPAVKRHCEKILNIELEKDSYVISTSELISADFYLKPVFGLVPKEMIESYPAGHAEMPPADWIEHEAMVKAVNTLIEFLKKHSNKKFIIKANKIWKRYLKNLPENTKIEWLT